MMLARVAERFDSTLHAPAGDLAQISRHHRVDVPVTGRYTDANGIEIIPTPGHSPGSVCYLVRGAEGRNRGIAGDQLGSQGIGNRSHVHHGCRAQHRGVQGGREMQRHSACRAGVSEPVSAPIAGSKRSSGKAYRCT